MQKNGPHFSLSSLLTPWLGSHYGGFTFLESYNTDFFHIGF